MSPQPTGTPLPDSPGQHAADPHGNREVLQDLITMGANFARLLHDRASAQAQAAPPPATPAYRDVAAQPAPDTLIPLAMAFDCIARAVRRCILLARSLDKPAQPASHQPVPDPAGTRAAARRRILREVGDAIQRTPGTADRPGADLLQAELHDRLDTPDLDDDLGTRPVADLITEICRDLGLAQPPGASRPWPRRTPGDIAGLSARAAAPSTPRHLGTGSQAPRQDAKPHSPDPQPDQPAPVPREQPGPLDSSSSPPWDSTEVMAETLTMILRHPTRDQGRQRPPPSG